MHRRALLAALPFLAGSTYLAPFAAAQTVVPVTPLLREDTRLNAIEPFARRDAGPKATHILRQSFTERLSIAFQINAGGRVRLMTDADFPQLSGNLDSLLQLAKTNINAAVRATTWKEQNGALVAHLAGADVTALILFDELWPDLERRLGGPAIAAMPADGQFAAVRANDAGRVARLRAWANGAQRNPITNVMLRHDRRRWLEVR